jgi:hypothetical protein
LADIGGIGNMGTGLFSKPIFEPIPQKKKKKPPA